MDPRHWVEVLNALIVLRCEEVHETDDAIFIRRWDVVASLPKDERVPICVQCDILQKLEIDEEHYVQILERWN